ncbi:MAG: hypothetical protein CBC24_03055 [Candidatus Pelagibacter sp. TMED64]|nr:hypothetical protein [Candidatus Pelagibacter sp.]OUU66485.1 MAG: hypothetical protein CBC24_03055 [Candidatus Pelagibacter sp. TMED64]
MKITKTNLTDLIRDELENFKIVKLSKDDMEQLHKTGQIEKDGVFYQYQEPVKEDFKIRKTDKLMNPIAKKSFSINAEKEDEIEEKLKMSKGSGRGTSWMNYDDDTYRMQVTKDSNQYHISVFKKFMGPSSKRLLDLKGLSKTDAAKLVKLAKSSGLEKTAKYGKSKYKKYVSEGKLNEKFDLKKLEIVIKSIQKKIKKQGIVTNDRDEEHLKQLIKVYKNMGGRKIKESVWGLPKGSNTTKMDELDAELSRAGIKSIPDFTKLIVQVKGNKGKINKIMKTHKAKKIFEGKRQQLSIPVMDKLKTDKILKKLRLKPGKDYDVGVGSRNSFILDIEGKYLDKLITLLMKQRIRVR